MVLVNLGEEKRKKLRGVSSAICVISNIARAFLIIGIVGIMIGAIFAINFVNAIEPNNGNGIGAKFGNATFEFTDMEEGAKFIVNGENVNIEDEEAKVVIRLIRDVFQKNTKTTLISFLVIALGFAIAELVLLFIVLKHLRKLFIHVKDDDSPFSEETVLYSKKMAHFMLAQFITSLVGSAVTNSILEQNLNLNISSGYSLIGILFVFAISYVFDYGYQLQLEAENDSNENT